MPTATNVTTAKPAVNGAVSVAPAGTSVPTDATTALANTFKSLGYIHEDGMTENVTRESNDIKAWGGDTVNSSQISHDGKFKFTLIEALNIEVLKVVFGNNNVTGTALSTGLTVKCNSAELESHAWVIDTIMREGVLQRICIPNGKVSEIGEVSYNDADGVGYEITVTCIPDSSGNKFYQYMKTPSSSGSGG